MAFQQRFGGPEFGKNIVVGHAAVLANRSGGYLCAGAGGRNGPKFLIATLEAAGCPAYKPPHRRPQSRPMVRLRRLLGGEMNGLKKLVPAIGLLMAAMPALAQEAASGELVGQPTPRGWVVQPQVTELGREAAWMHNVILVPVIVAIGLFVM